MVTANEVIGEWKYYFQLFKAVERKQLVLGYIENSVNKRVLKLEFTSGARTRCCNYRSSKRLSDCLLHVQYLYTKYDTHKNLTSNVTGLLVEQVGRTKWFML